jgi:hypothetical protein
VVVAGPDGAGKSTVVEHLVREVLPGPTRRLHHRPHLLRGRSSGDQVVTEPHRDPPYPTWLSVVKLCYLYVDFLLGWTLRVRPWLRDGGDVVIERGWWDLSVDPLRYRLQVPSQVARFLGHLLPRPDVTVVLGGSPAPIAARKSELSVDETARQLAEWKRLPQRALRAVHVDTGTPIAQVRDRVQRAVIASLSDDRWVLLPTATAPRWYLPASPARASVNSLQLYHPVTPLGRGGWELARAVAALGGFRILARDGCRPPDEVLDLLAPHAPPGARIAVAQGRHRGRNNAIILDGRSGAICAFAKIARDPAGPAALAAEVAASESLTPRLPAGLRAPLVYHHQEYVAIFEPVVSWPRFRPWRLPPEVATLLGVFFRAGLDGQGRGLAHGDCAPWNLVRVAGGWALVDWSDARTDAPPFEDLFHYIVQSHALLGRPTRSELLEGLAGRGPTGEAVRGYAEGAGVGVEDARECFVSYLRRSFDGVDATTADGRRARRAREALMTALTGSADPGGAR